MLQLDVSWVDESVQPSQMMIRKPLVVADGFSSIEFSQLSRFTLQLLNILMLTAAYI